MLRMSLLCGRKRSIVSVAPMIADDQIPCKAQRQEIQKRFNQSPLAARKIAPVLARPSRPLSPPTLPATGPWIYCHRGQRGTPRQEVSECAILFVQPQNSTREPA
jgi:hypothetical protein